MILEKSDHIAMEYDNTVFKVYMSHVFLSVSRRDKGVGNGLNYVF